MVKETLQICDGEITTVLKKKALTGILEPDKRGRHTPHNKTDAISEEYVCNFNNLSRHMCHIMVEQKWAPKIPLT
jgi:hypothetical protein